MTYQIRPASRSQAKPLIGLYSESGAGKTYTALLMARGFVGAKGRICMIETESGRGEAYASSFEYPELSGDDKTSNYDVLSLRDDFSPQAYGQAITAIENGKYDALIIDSASHEWEAAGGVLDMASKNQDAGKKGMIVWQKPKIDHQKHFMLRFMQTPLPLVILCMRAKYPMIMTGKDPVRSKELEPKQSEDILFEMFVHGWIEKGNHAFHPTKVTASSLRSVFADGKPITKETGVQLALWAKGTAPSPTTTETTQSNPEHQSAARKVHTAIKAEANSEMIDKIFTGSYKTEMDYLKAEKSPLFQWLIDEGEKKKNMLRENSGMGG